MKSIWKDTVEMPRFPKLDGDVKTDVLIIGGGITGILCGYMLKESGIDCIVAEKDRICRKTTENTTAKITFQHGLIYDKIIKNYGLEAAQLYLDANKKALDKYRDLCQNADCDFGRVDSFVYSLNDREKIEREIRAFERIGQKAELVENLPIPIPVSAAVKLRNQAQFNPLKLISGLVKGMKIFENTEISEILPDGSLTEKGRIKAEKIIVATHFPFINKYGGYFLKMYQHRSYVLALENAPDVKGIYVDESDKGMSFRNYKNLLLLGGGGHRTGKKRRRL